MKCDFLDSFSKYCFRCSSCGAYYRRPFVQNNVFRFEGNRCVLCGGKLLNPIKKGKEVS